MYRVDTHTDVPVVKEKQQAYQKGERELFPDPQNGFELAANFHRSEQQKLLTFSERVLYLLLCDYVGRRLDGRYYWCCPSISTLAEKMCVTDRAVRKCLQALKTKGFVEIEARFRNGCHTSNSFRLKPASLVGTEQPFRGWVNNGSGGVLNGGSGKETSGEETRVKETSSTPISPKRDGGRVCFDQSVFDAICRECRLDPNVNKRKVARAASRLTKAGYTAGHVEFTADFVRGNWPDHYDGNVTIRHLEENIAESLTDYDQSRIWKN